MNNATTYLINETESARLDDLAAYCSTLLNAVHGQELDRVLAGEAKRRARSDVAFREHALATAHPDDLVAALVRAGLSLAKLGIAGVSR